uniref:Uncharacterized protein n=1 Tax=Arundo donax TaxID=35708 RepID=A0A0A9DXP4_ARUDO
MCISNLEPIERRISMNKLVPHVYEAVPIKREIIERKIEY